MLDTAEIAGLSWCDAEFFGFRWRGNDLCLYLKLASTDIEELRCHWATDLKANVEWARPAGSREGDPLRRGGPLLTWDGSLTTRGDGRWALSLDFAHDGSIELECEKVTVAGHTPATA